MEKMTGYPFKKLEFINIYILFMIFFIHQNGENT